MTRREPGLPASWLVEGQLHAFLALVFDVGEADHVGCRLALGVLALVFLALVDALDVECRNLLAHIPVQLALHPDEGLVLVGELGDQRRQRHVHQPGQLAQLGAAPRVFALHVFGNGPDAGRGHAGGQDQPVAIQNLAAVGGQLQRAGKAHLALALEEIVARHLHIGGARAQPDKAQRQSCATMNLLRQTGVLLASNGLEV